MKKIFAISDIHGHYKEMREALDKVGYDEKNENHLLIVCGDCFDRGRENLKVYEYLKRLTDNNKAIVIMGNHDLMLAEYLKGEVISSWNYIHNGTNETLADFLHQTLPFESWCVLENHCEMNEGNFGIWIEKAREMINEEYPELLTWLISRPYYYETSHYIFTHGAIDTKVEDWHKPHCYRYAYTDWKALTWSVGSFFGSDIKNTDKTVVIGHFGTEQLRKMYGYSQNRNPLGEYDILRRKDGKVIAIDSTVVVSKKINVLVVEDE